MTLERSLPSFVSIHAASDIRSNYGEPDPRTEMTPDEAAAIASYLMLTRLRCGTARSATPDR